MAEIRRALVTGAAGFLGSNLAPLLARRGWAVCATWHSRGGDAAPIPGVETRHLDVCIQDQVDALLEEVRPDWIFHLAAIADPDACAADEPSARQINVQASRHLARAAASRGIRMALLSTDQVFDGTRALWREEDPPAPLGAYGRSKRDAERVVAEAGGSPLIVRLALTYGWGRGPARGRNFAERWLRAFLTGNRVRAFTDQWRTPIYGEDACLALAEAAERGLDGLLHLAGPERATRHDFAVRLAREFGFPESSVVASALNDVVFKDPRPPDASLETARLRSLGLGARGITAGLEAMHRELERL